MQETNTGSKAKMPDHYLPTIICAVLWEEEALQGRVLP